MTRRIPPPILLSRPVAGLKDEHGSYLPLADAPPPPSEPHSPSPADTSLDEVLGRQLLALDRLTRHLASKASSNTLTVTEMTALATLIRLTMELKVKENELLDTLSEEELKASVDGNSDTAED